MKKILILLIILLVVKSTPTFAEKAAKDIPFRFSVMSDIHVQAGYEKSIRRFQSALTDLTRLGFSDTLVINGDLSNGMPGDLQTLNKVLKNTPHPQQVYYTIGNHEFFRAWRDFQGNWKKSQFPNGESEQQSIQRFLDLTGEKKVYYDRWIKNYHFIFLGSEHYRQTNPSFKEDAYLSVDQLNWLKEKLAEGDHREGKPVFVFLHQPLPYTVSGSNGWGNERGVIQSKQLKEILVQHPEVILFSGHTHWELKLPTTLVQHVFTMVNSSSVLEPWSNKNEPVQGIHSEGLCIEVHRDKVVIKGRDFAKRKWIVNAEYTLYSPFHLKETELKGLWSVLPM